MTPAERAISLFQEGFNCSQSVLAAWCSRFGLDEETALKMAAGLGGGIGRTGGICGALTGAILVLGLRYGTADPKDKNTKYVLYRKTQTLMEQFKANADARDEPVHCLQNRHEHGGQQGRRIDQARRWRFLAMPSAPRPSDISPKVAGPGTAAGAKVKYESEMQPDGAHRRS